MALLLAINKSNKLQLLAFTCTSQKDIKIKICRFSCVLQDIIIRLYIQFGYSSLGVIAEIIFVYVVTFRHC